MRTLARSLSSLFAVVLSGVFAVTASAQTNPYPPTAYWNTVIRDGTRDVSVTACSAASAASSPNASTYLANSCGVNRNFSLPYSYRCGFQTCQGTDNFYSGNFSGGGESQVSPGGPDGHGFVHTALNGTVSDFLTATSNTGATLFDYIGVSGPDDIASAVLSMTYNANGSVAPGSDMGGSIFLEALGVTTSGFAGSALNQQFAPAIFDGLAHTVEAAFTWDAVPNNVFAYSLNPSVFVQNLGSSSSGAATLSWSDPTVRFYDAAGNDVTGEHTIAYDPGGTISADPIVATPEPASFTLLATGLAGMGGLAGFRRRVRGRG